MGVVIYKPKSYNGRHNRCKLTLFILLDTLKTGEGPWSKGEYYSLSRLASYSVESLSYRYLQSRLPTLTGWKYLHRKALEPDYGGRAVYGYAIAPKAQRDIENAPQDVYAQCLGRVLEAMPGLGPSVKPAPAPVRKQPEPRPVHTTPKDDVNVSTESDFQPDPKTMYCMEGYQAGERHYCCGYPWRECQLYEELPSGAVLLGRERTADWNRTRQRPG